MTELEEVVKIEELKWRQKSYEELTENPDEVIFYIADYENKKFKFEIHKKKNKLKNEIVVMVEGAKDSLFGNLAARAKYFVKSKTIQRVILQMMKLSKIINFVPCGC